MKLSTGRSRGRVTQSGAGFSRSPRREREELVPLPLANLGQSRLRNSALPGRGVATVVPAALAATGTGLSGLPTTDVRLPDLGDLRAQELGGTATLALLRVVARLAQFPAPLLPLLRLSRRGRGEAQEGGERPGGRQPETPARPGIEPLVLHVNLLQPHATGRSRKDRSRG